MSNIDYSKYAEGVETEEELKAGVEAAQSARFGFKPKTWYKFRSITMTGKKVSAPKDKAGNPIEAKGNRYIMETVRALRPDGSLSTKAKEIRNITTLWSKTPPGLLAEVGYTTDQIEAIGHAGLPNVLEMTAARFAAFDPEKINQSNPDWMKNLRQLQIQAWLENVNLAGSEFYAQVYYQTRGGYTNANLQYIRGTAPKNADGTEQEIGDPDA